MTEAAKIVFYVYGALTYFKELGLIAGGKYILSPKGQQIYRTLKTTGYCPSVEEVEAVLGRLFECKKESAATLRIFDLYINGQLEETLAEMGKLIP